MKAKYFNSNVNRSAAPTKVFVTIYEHRGQTNEKITKEVITLKSNKEMHDIMTLKM